MTSKTTYKEIVPTYLYIKQHSITGLKYFGKTTRPDPIKYLGSGTRWTKHIEKFGKEFVETIWLSDLYYDTSIVEHSLHFSSENKIDTSPNIWANHIPENGLDGGVSGRKHSDETKAKISASHIGKTHSEETKLKLSNINNCKIMSDETRTKISETSKDRTHSQYTKDKISASNSNPSKETRTKRSNSMKGNIVSEETRIKMSLAKKGRVLSDEQKAKISSSISAKFFSLISTKKTYTKNKLSTHFPEFKQYY